MIWVIITISWAAGALAIGGFLMLAGCRERAARRRSVLRAMWR